LPSRIDLLIPGLFGPVPVPPADLPATPVLGRLLGRADRGGVSASGPVQTLLERFGVAPDPSRDPPSAPFCLLADLPAAETAGYVLHADPVHLRPDRDRLLLFDASHLAISGKESDALIGLFNRHFGEDGLRLEPGASGRWYLHVGQRPLLRTTSLNDAIGRDIRSLMPAGPDARSWARRLNEAQMLFHHAEINRVREQEGRPTINGLWVWGGGSLTDFQPQSDYARVFGEDALASGLAAALTAPVQPLPEDAGELSKSRGEGAVLAYLDALWRPVLDADGPSWIDALERLETWLTPLVEGGRLAGARWHIYPCDGECYRISRQGLRRFWRRPFDLGSRLQGAAQARSC
jgi:hypothetical protein